MHQLQEIMFLLILREDDFNSQTKKLLSATRSFLDRKNSDIFTKIKEKHPYQTPVVARFRDT